MTTGFVLTLPAMYSEVWAWSGVNASRVRMWTPTVSLELSIAPPIRNHNSYDRPSLSSRSPRGDHRGLSVSTHSGSAPCRQDLPDHRPGRMDGSSRSIGDRLPAHGPDRPPWSGEVRWLAAVPPAGTRREAAHRDGLPASSAVGRPTGSGVADPPVDRLVAGDDDVGREAVASRGAAPPRPSRRGGSGRRSGPPRPGRVRPRRRGVRGGPRRRPPRPRGCRRRASRRSGSRSTSPRGCSGRSSRNRTRTAPGRPPAGTPRCRGRARAPPPGPRGRAGGHRRRTARSLSPARITRRNDSRGRTRAAASSSRSTRLTGRRFELCSTTASSVTPSSCRTSSRVRRGGRGSK